MSFDVDKVSVAGGVILERRLQAARESFDDFVEFAMRDEEGKPMVMAAHHRVWRVHLESCWKAGKHPAILAPWAHGKSQQCVVARVAYELGRNPNLRIKVVCNNNGSAMERIEAISNFILSDSYRMVFPHIRPATPIGKAGRMEWSKHQIHVHRKGRAIDASVGAYGILSTGIGGRADLLVFDDVVDERNAILNPKNRQKTIDVFQRTWMGRLEPHGRVLFIGTPWHLEDLTHWIRERPAWSTLRMWVGDNFDRLECEVYNLPEAYPLPRATPARKIPRAA